MEILFMKRISLFAVTLISFAYFSSAVQAATVSWTDWTDADSNSVVGDLVVDTSVVGVTASGIYSFAQTNGTGTNFWLPSTPYISTSVSNAPPNSDIVALNAGGTETITFSQAVSNPLVAFASWNNNTVDFGVPIEILSYGAGYWGNGTFQLNEAGTGFYGVGEVHGVVQLPGVYSSISFTNSSENWHGFTVGVAGLPSEVPIPAAFWLFGSAFTSLLGFARRKQRNSAGCLIDSNLAQI